MGDRAKTATQHVYFLTCYNEESINSRQLIVTWQQSDAQSDHYAAPRWQII